MAESIILIFLSSLICYIACDPLIVNDCGSGDGDLMNLKSVYLKPQEIPVPGDLAVSVEVAVHKDVLGAQLDLDIHVSRYVGFLWVPVPCVSNVGSCKYDACDLLHPLNTEGCPPQLTNSNFPCTCETIKAGTYNMSNQVFNLPKVTGIWSWLASGDYKVDGTLTDRTTGRQVGCLHFEVTIVDPTACSGFLCSIFGGK